MAALLTPGNDANVRLKAAQTVGAPVGIEGGASIGRRHAFQAVTRSMACLAEAYELARRWSVSGVFWSALLGLDPIIVGVLPRLNLRESLGKRVLS